MKQQLIYETSDILNLIAQDIERRGYAVSPEDLEIQTDWTVSTTVTDEMRVTPVAVHGLTAHVAPATPLAPASPPPSSSKEKVAGDVPAAPKAPVSRSGVGMPISRWNSHPKDGSDPRFNLPPEPTLAPRVPKIKELGTQTGLLARMGLPENPEDSMGEGTGDFLDKYRDDEPELPAGG